MTVETVRMTDRVAIPWTTKVNPLWWLHGPDGWTVPEINNGQPYLPDVTNVWLRRFYWFICRNPLMNFVGFVLGVEDKNFSVTGSSPVLRTTGRDCEPQQLGWRWALITTPISVAAMVVALLLAAGAWFLSPWMWPMAAFAALRTVGFLPYISYWGPLWKSDRNVEFYLGWRPASGGFGVKLVFPEKPETQMVGA